MSAINVRDFGAVGDGVCLNTSAFARAVDAATAAGGGMVLVPAGRWVTGPIVLRSDVELRVEAGAVILGSQNPADYPMVEGRWEGTAGRTHLSLISATDAERVSVTGRGVIDARGEEWWKMVRAGNLPAPRPRLMNFVRCQNVRIEAVTLRNSPAWTIHPFECENLTVSGVTIANPPNSPNTDGINPESCSNVHISDCHIDVGDDCITLKAGADAAANPLPCQNITITNCTMVHGHGGVVIGSEMSGGVRNVVITNCIFDGTDRGIRIKTRRGRGGIVEDIRASNIIMSDVHCPVVMHMFYKYTVAKGEDLAWCASSEPQAVTPTTPVIRNIHLAHITAKNVRGPAAGFLYGLPEQPIAGVTLDDIRISLREEVDPRAAGVAMMLHPIPEVNGDFYARWVKDLRVRDLAIEGRNAKGLRVIDEVK